MVGVEFDVQPPSRGEFWDSWIITLQRAAFLNVTGTTVMPPLTGPYMLQSGVGWRQKIRSERSEKNEEDIL